MIADLTHIPLENLLAEVQRRQSLHVQAGLLLARWRPEIRRILASTAPAFGLASVEDIFLPTRRVRITSARHCAIGILRARLHLTYQEISDIFGHQDHGTALHAYNSHTARLDTDPAYLATYHSVLKALDTPAK